MNENDFDNFDYPGSYPGYQNVPPTSTYDAQAYGPQNAPSIHSHQAPREKSDWPSRIVLVAVASIVASSLTLAATGLNDNRSNSERTVTISAASPVTQATVAGAQQSVFTIAVQTNASQGSGSGVAIDEEHIITNAHVVTLGGAYDKNAKIEVQDSKGNEAKAEIVGIDLTADLAVLKISDKKLSPLTWAEKDVVVGEPVLALGSPLRLSDTVTSGIVSAVNRPVALGQDETNAPEESSTFINTIQTDAAINSGNSGGALVNGKGELVGINVAISSSGNNTGSIGIGYAIPAAYAERVVNEIIETGSASHGYLGVRATTAASKGGNFPDGALLQEVVAKSPAAEAGLQKNDVIVSFNNLPIVSSEALTASAKAVPPNTEVEVIARRGNRDVNFDVTLDKAV